MRPNLDTSIFSIICEIGNCLYTPEVDLADMRAHKLVEDIRTGQLERVRAVLEFNPVEGWCNDITEDVMRKAFPERDDLRECAPENWSDYEAERVECRRAGITARVAA
nr:hypothetical protein [uncultured Roseibium sp.]